VEAISAASQQKIQSPLILLIEKKKTQQFSFMKNHNKYEYG
jgi:hypothetical protein